MAALIDLSADIGEGFGAYRLGDDARILASVSSANVACGFHAGDPRTMDAAVRACIDHGVAVGAHPGFADLVGFGRRTVVASPEEIRTDVLYQLGALQGFAAAHGTPLVHVSAHGRLGNLVVTDEHYARPVLEAVEAFDRRLIVVTYPGVLQRLCRDHGLKVGVLGFPDRAYEDDGTLVDRVEPGAVIHDPELIAERAVRLATERIVLSRNGVRVEVPADSLLLHGDNEASVQAAARVRSAVEAAGVVVAPLTEVLRSR